MAPDPDKVHEHHHVAAGFVGEEMEAEVPVERQHRQRRGQNRECSDDHEIGGERRPAKHRHAHIGHAGGVYLEDGGDEIDPSQQRANAGDLHSPQVVVDPDVGRIVELRERRKRQPASAGELAYDQRQVDEERSGRGQPETDRIEGREGDVAHAELQRHDDIHEPDHERHGDEEDHDRAMGGEDLIVMLRRQIALGLERQSLLRAHHDGVREAAQQHHRRQRDVHDPDPLVIDAGDPFAPQIGNPPLECDEGDPADQHQDDEAARSQGDRLAQRNGVPSQLPNMLVPPPNA